MVRLTPCTHGACIPLHEDPLRCKPLYEILSVTWEGAALWMFYTPRKTLRFTLVCFTVVFKLSRDFKWNHSAWDSDMTLSPGNTLGHVHSYLRMRTACVYRLNTSDPGSTTFPACWRLKPSAAVQHLGTPPTHTFSAWFPSLYMSFLNVQSLVPKE